MTKIWVVSRGLAGILCLVVILAGCGGGTAGSSAPAGSPTPAQTGPGAAATATVGIRPSTTTESGTPSGTPAAVSPTYLPGAVSAVAAAKADLAKTLNIDVSSITVVKIEEHEWRDEALGCSPPLGRPLPLKGIPGYLITLAAGGTSYEYHADKDGKMVTCTPKTMTNGGNSVQTQMVSLAKQDLAAQLSIDAATIQVVSVEEQTWQDTRLGCPPPPMNPVLVVTPGYRIVLSAGGKSYEYHTDKTSKLIRCGNLQRGSGDGGINLGSGSQGHRPSDWPHQRAGG